MDQLRIDPKYRYKKVYFHLINTHMPSHQKKNVLARIQDYYF